MPVLDQGVRRCQTRRPQGQTGLSRLLFIPILKKKKTPQKKPKSLHSDLQSAALTMSTATVEVMHTLDLCRWLWGFGETSNSVSGTFLLPDSPIGSKGSKERPVLDSI